MHWFTLLVRRLFGLKTPYAAIFLDPESQMGLVRWWDREVGIPLHKHRKSHHMTIWYDPPRRAQLPLGLRAGIEIVGWAADDRCQTVAVRSVGVPSQNTHAHITVAVAEGTNPVYSNELLAQGCHAVEGPKLYGVVEVRSD